MIRNAVSVALIACLLVMPVPPAVPAEARAPERLRVISLAPSSTEILFALGLDDEIVGVSQYCDYPQAVGRKERVGTFSRPNIERIVSLKPDVIFCTSLEQAPAVVKLRQLGFKVCVSDPSSLEGLYLSIGEMGRLTGKEDSARRLIAGMRERVRGIADKSSAVPKSERPKVYLEFWDNPMMTAGSGSFIDELITIAGGVNIASDVKKVYSYFSAEEVVKRDPDVIILSYMRKKSAVNEVRDRFGWENVSAVRSSRVYNDIDPDIILRPGPRIVEGLSEMHKRFYP